MMAANGNCCGWPYGYGGCNALIADKDGDAKLLEIIRTAAQMALDYVKGLRGMALESAHGNRSNADKLSTA